MTSLSSTDEIQTIADGKPGHLRNSIDELLEQLQTGKPATFTVEIRAKGTLLQTFAFRRCQSLAELTQFKKAAAEFLGRALDPDANKSAALKKALVGRSAEDVVAAFTLAHWSADHQFSQVDWLKVTTNPALTEKLLGELNSQFETGITVSIFDEVMAEKKDLSKTASTE